MLFQEIDVKNGSIPSLRTCLRFAKGQETERIDKQQAYEKNQSHSFFKRLSTAQKEVSHFIGGRASTELLDQLLVQASSTHSAKQDVSTSSKMRRKTRNQRIRQQLDLEVDL